MNIFNIPKKVNRHVLKALNVLSDGNIKKRIPMARILNQVQYQMRDLVPVPNIESVVQNSLNNLSDIGLIERSGPNQFAIGRSYGPSTLRPPPPPSHLINPYRRSFMPNGSRKRSINNLDPNEAHSRRSEDSMSGDDFDRTRKRLRSNNKKLKHTGRDVTLPKARQHYARPQGYAAFVEHNNLRMTTEWPEVGLLLSARNSNMEFVPLSTSTPARSLELIEIQTDETSNEDAMQREWHEEQVNKFNSEQNKSREDIEANSSQNNTDLDTDNAEKKQNDSPESSNAVRYNLENSKQRESHEEQVTEFTAEQNKSQENGEANSQNSTGLDMDSAEKKQNESPESSNAVTDILEIMLPPRQRHFLN